MNSSPGVIVAEKLGFPGIHCDGKQGSRAHDASHDDDDDVDWRSSGGSSDDREAELDGEVWESLKTSVSREARL